MQCVNFTDDELWNAIAENTDALSELQQQRAELDAEISEATDFAAISNHDFLYEHG